jgi:regulatory protein
MAEQPFRDAEAWLAARGVRRERIQVRPGTPDVADGAASPAPDPATPTSGDAHGPAVRAREAQRLATASADEALRRQDEAATDRAHRSEPRLEDEVAEAVAFVRRSTATSPQAEGRLAAKLTERGWSSAVVAQALERSRAVGLVDDAAMAAALVEEGRRKGHAPARLRADLRRRELDEGVIDRALAPVREQDPEAVAFDVARRKAATLSGVSAETAFRRVVGHLARRGHPEALARKVARAAVFDARDPQRTAGH